MNTLIYIGSWGKWVKSPYQFNTFVNHKGDQITFLNPNHALINCKQLIGFVNIYSKILELERKTT
jgi:hypothetical protein